MADAAMRTLRMDEAEVHVVPIDSRRWRVTTRSLRGAMVPRASCETTFPPHLIEMLLTTTGGEWICDAIARHEDPITSWQRFAVSWSHISRPAPLLTKGSLT
jgi:hypothetical protein